jgi:hypothetical protein
MSSIVVRYFLVAAAATFVSAAETYAKPIKPPQEHAHSSGKSAQCPMMQEKDSVQAKPSHAHPQADHHSEMNARGDKAMGFSQAKTTHHFRLLSDGGAIEVEANDVKDTASRNQIREHLAHIARVFANGDFAIPKDIHDQVPPGTAVMKQAKESIAYRFEETERGGRVRISTSNNDALAAIHEFLRFQIKEHQTGDPLDVAR